MCVEYNQDTWWNKWNWLIWSQFKASLGFSGNGTAKSMAVVMWFDFLKCVSFQGDKWLHFMPKSMSVVTTNPWSTPALIAYGETWFLAYKRATTRVWKESDFFFVRLWKESFTRSWIKLPKGDSDRDIGEALCTMRARKRFHIEEFIHRRRLCSWSLLCFHWVLVPSLIWLYTLLWWGTKFLLHYW